MEIPTIEVSGIWLKGAGTDHVEVLAEVDGIWKVVIPAERVSESGQVQTVSHCVHPSGIENAKIARFGN